MSRGDRNRNARLDRLRALVPVTNAIAGIDLAGKKQMVVVAHNPATGNTSLLNRLPLSGSYSFAGEPSGRVG